MTEEVAHPQRRHNLALVFLVVGDVQRFEDVDPCRDAFMPLRSERKGKQHCPAGRTDEALWQIGQSWAIDCQLT